MEKRYLMRGRDDCQIARAQGVATVRHVRITLGPINIIEGRGIQHYIRMIRLHCLTHGIELRDIEAKMIKRDYLMLSQNRL
jgi:hypothetical protein